MEHFIDFTTVARELQGLIPVSKHVEREPMYDTTIASESLRQYLFFLHGYLQITTTVIAPANR
jgi:hypothetical protein